MFYSILSFQSSINDVSIPKYCPSQHKLFFPYQTYISWLLKLFHQLPAGSIQGNLLWETLKSRLRVNMETLLWCARALHPTFSQLEWVQMQTWLSSWVQIRPLKGTFISGGHVSRYTRACSVQIQLERDQRERDMKAAHSQKPSQRQV